MKSWKIARLAGIDVSIHWTFLILIGWVGISALTSGGVTAALYNLTFVAAVFGCVVLHELGHALAARQFGIGTRGITLMPIGGVAMLDRMPREPLHELWIAVAGPLVNVVIAGSLIFVIPITALSPLHGLAFGSTSLLTQLFVINVIMILFNMLPAFPMDGGRVLRSLLAMFVPYLTATRIAAGVGKVMAVIFGIAGVLWSPILIFVAAFVYLAGSAEAKMVEAQQQYQPNSSGQIVGEYSAQPGQPIVIVIDDPGHKYHVEYRSPPTISRPYGWQQ